MGRPRELPPVMEALTHDQGMRRCMVCTSSAVQTISLPEGHFVSLVVNQPAAPGGAIIVMDRDEVEALILLLRNAMADADLLDAGKAPVHASPSHRRH